MSYYVLLDPSTDLTDPNLLIEFDNSVVVDGLSELQSLQFPEDCQVVRVHHSVVTKRKMRPDEVRAHYPSLAIAVAQERILERQDLSYLACQLTLLLEEEPDSLEKSALALGCLISYQNATCATDAKTLGLHQPNFKSEASAFLKASKREAALLHKFFLYMTQTQIIYRYAKAQQLLGKELFIAADLKSQLSPGSVYLILESNHSYLVSFKKSEDGEYLIAKFELVEKSETPPEIHREIINDETQAYKKLVSILQGAKFCTGTSHRLTFSLFELNLTPEELETCFEQFTQDCEKKKRVWGTLAIYGSTCDQEPPSQRNCHAFVYTLLQIIVEQKAADPFEKTTNPSLTF